MSPERPVYKANQIGKFFASQRHADPAAGIAGHLTRFWDPRLRRTIVDHVGKDGEGLDPPVLQAVKLLAS